MVMVHRPRPDTIEFFEGVGNVSTRVRVRPPGDLASRAVGGFPVPVDRVFELATDRVTIERVPTVVIRKPDGTPVEVADRAGRTRYVDSVVLVEICTLLKLYLLVEGGLTVHVEDGATTISTDVPAMTIGVRAPLETPIETVTTSTDIPDLFAAISSFGSALDTTTPARAFPSERNHPPLLDLGDGLDIPTSLAPPSPEITVQVPGTYLYGAMAAPLVYYLGARLREGSPTGIAIEDTVVHELPQGMAFPDAVADVLRRVLLLDAMLATSHWYDLATGERAALEGRLPLAWDDLYHRSPADRLREYLALPAEDLEPFLPEPGQRVYIVPTTRMLRALPYLAHDLASLRPPSFSHRLRAPRARADGGRLRAPNEDLPPSPSLGRLSTDVESIGADLPVGQHPAFPQAFHNRLAHRVDGEDIEITLACTDEKMAPELRNGRSLYNARDDIPITVRVEEDLTTEDLSAIMHRRTDYFHYIGHIDHEGFVCTDGRLNARDLDDVSIELFFLNSCESRRQAIALIEAGAWGGIATDHRVRNRAATRIGIRIAESLSRGYPLGLSLALTRASDPTGERYSIVGDPKLSISSTASGIPYSCQVRSFAEDRFELTVETHLSESAAPGMLCSFHLGGELPYFVHPTKRTFEVTERDLIEFFELENVPVEVDGERYWSFEWVDREGY